VGLGKRFDSCRAASFDLTDRTYRVMRMTLDCGGPDRQGMLLALPLLATALPNRTIRTHAGDGQATQFEADYYAEPDWSAAALPL
jgi:hypothetical protein